ncbi:UPF0235 protein C15orf40 homolog isoform X2 [Archocentrus centrarchus]|uniref:UPF0235 protein C15orf40 homolog isoform X2 n=1 Tax=Archocentrus centrarchus TaxID=63155 RepID=UPI0011E9FA7E|nr:UPF0235 protein C15orf40 homolog isoform X2 [Archocentrus centrarchus]
MFSRLGVPEALLCIKFLASLQQAGSVTSKAVTLPVLSCRYRLPPLSGVALHRRLYSGSRNRQMPQKVKGQKSDGGGAAIEACGPVTRDKNEVSAESVSVAISAPPTDGEANAELIRYLAEVLDMKKSHVSLDKGSRSRDKLIRVHASLSPEEVLKRLREAAG